MNKINKPVAEWCCEEVQSWLVENGFAEYGDLLACHHKVDGRVLLSLTEEDLRNPPISLPLLGDIKRMILAIDRLKPDKGKYDGSGSYYDLQHVCYQHGSGHELSSKTLPPSTSSERPRLTIPLLFCMIMLFHSILCFLSLMYHSEVHHNLIISRIEADDTQSRWNCILKTVVAGFHFLCSIFLTSYVMVIVHDRVPDSKTYPPLPDLLLDNIPHIPWAFDLCELLACLLGLIWCTILVFHKHRLILLRRFFSLTGTVFILRCITMLITSLSVPGAHLKCTARKSEDSYTRLKNALHIWYGMGMSLFGVRSCGDYMFSGHTTVMTLLNHFITEYTPDTWNYLHTTSWVINLFAVFFILAGHEHYSIDVFVAFYISSRLFLYYHSMAYHVKSVTAADTRTRIWFPLFWFLESGSQCGRIPNEYEWPLPSFASICELFDGSYFIKRSKSELEFIQSKYRIQFDRVHEFLFHDHHCFTESAPMKSKHKAKIKR
ncbi:unnamed protein product [Soboliphyme baturini]|uniref:SAM domain-containing protein n=1 Tax=Soboliphyme baturini TaxID=241478 RepID=A0A183IUI6_9BILA|nr:unnamed protein product [Soboliphyme baturini]